MQVDGIGCDPSLSVVGPEYVVACLLIVAVHVCSMLFSLFGELVCPRAIAGAIRFVR